MAGSSLFVRSGWVPACTVNADRGRTASGGCPTFSTGQQRDDLVGGARRAARGDRPIPGCAALEHVAQRAGQVAGRRCGEVQRRTGAVVPQPMGNVVLLLVMVREGEV